MHVTLTLLVSLEEAIVQHRHKMLFSFIYDQVPHRLTNRNLAWAESHIDLGQISGI
jgi:hypothetical protein